MANKKKSRKRKPKTLKHKPVGLPAYDIKISEAILNLSEPLRNQYTDSHRTRVIISMTVMAWNISLFPKDEQVNAQQALIDALPEKFGAEDISVFLENIDILIERKNKDYPHIRKYIHKYQLSFSGDTITLTVGSAPIPE
jgi:hypothetical protein